MDNTNIYLFFYFSKSSAPSSRNALKLGGKNKDVDSFVDQLKSEGEKITNLTPVQTTAAGPIRTKPDIPMDE